MTNWLALDPGTAKLIFVGPMLSKALQGAVLRQADLIKVPQVAIDGGIAFADKPVLWTGDGDSGTAPKNTASFIKHDQNKTDLCFCLEGIQGWQWHELHLFGFLGGRRDHELANFGEVHAALKTRQKSSSAVFYDENGTASAFLYTAGEHKLSLHGRFSVLVLEPAQMTIAGACLFQAENLVLEPFSSRGISNEGFGQVKVHATQPFIVMV